MWGYRRACARITGANAMSTLVRHGQLGSHGPTELSLAGPLLTTARTGTTAEFDPWGAPGRKTVCGGAGLSAYPAMEGPRVAHSGAGSVAARPRSGSGGGFLGGWL